MNEILQLKFDNQYSDRNTVNEGLIPGLNNILNSREYKLLNHIQATVDDPHINHYYEIFTEIDHISPNIGYLANLMNSQLQTLSQFDPVLHLNIMAAYFMGYPSVSSYMADYSLHIQDLQYI